MYNGILVYSLSDELESEFYKKVCGDKMKLVGTRDVLNSQLTVYNALQSEQSKPNVFVVVNERDYYFNWENYESCPL